MRGPANSQTGRFAERCFADKLYEVTALPVASWRPAGAHFPVAVPTTCARHLMLLVIIDREIAEELKFVNQLI